MTPHEIHILDLPRAGGRKTGRLYYLQGNFFHPLNLTGNQPGLIARGIRDFHKAHPGLMERDRKDPAYRTLDQLADLQPS